MQLMFFASAATESTEESDLLGALGIDWLTLISQIAAFLVLVFLFSKFVFPVLIKTIDKRQADIDASLKAADEARRDAEASEAKIAKMLEKARKEAADIVLTAEGEATRAIELAQTKAETKAQAVVAQAQQQIAKDVIAAKKELRAETIELVAMATEKVIGKTLTDDIDKTIIRNTVEEIRN